MVGAPVGDGVGTVVSAEVGDVIDNVYGGVVVGLGLWFVFNMGGQCCLCVLVF